MVPGLGKALFSFLLPLPPARQPGGLAQPPPQLHAQLRASPQLQAPASLTTHTSPGGLRAILFFQYFPSFANWFSPTRLRVLPYERFSPTSPRLSPTPQNFPVHPAATALPVETNTTEAPHGVRGNRPASPKRRPHGRRAAGCRFPRPRAVPRGCAQAAGYLL